MSRIGRKPISIPSGVEVKIGNDNLVEVKGPKGTLAQRLHRNLTVTQENGTVSVIRPDDAREHRSVHGLSRTLINNMVIGVTEGFKKNLEIQGVGYRAAIDGKSLVLNVGYSHPVRMNPVEGVMFAVDGPNKIIVSGADKQLVGEEAARIRRTRPPEPYKGKGIRYEGEYVRRKAGKTGKAK